MYDDKPSARAESSQNCGTSAADLSAEFDGEWLEAETSDNAGGGGADMFDAETEDEAWSEEEEEVVSKGKRKKCKKGKGKRTKRRHTGKKTKQRKEPKSGNFGLYALDTGRE